MVSAVELSDVFCSLGGCKISENFRSGQVFRFWASFFSRRKWVSRLHLQPDRYVPVCLALRLLKSAWRKIRILNCFAYCAVVQRLVISCALTEARPTSETARLMRPNEPFGPLERHFLRPRTSFAARPNESFCKPQAIFRLLRRVSSAHPYPSCYPPDCAGSRVRFVKIFYHSLPRVSTMGKRCVAVTQLSVRQETTVVCTAIRLRFSFRLTISCVGNNVVVKS